MLAKQSELKQNTKHEFLGILLGTSGASLLGQLITGTGLRQSKILGRRVMRPGECTIRTGQTF